jgi:hypothetical protein
MLFHMVNQNSPRIDLAGAQRIHDQSRAFAFVLKMRRMNKNQLIVLFSQSDLLFENDLFSFADGNRASELLNLMGSFLLKFGEFRVNELDLFIFGKKFF